MNDEEVRFIESRIKEEILFHPISEVRSPPGGRGGRIIWGWHTEAPGAGEIVSFKEAEGSLHREVLDAVRIYEEVFQDCKTEICTARRLAMVDMIFDLGETKFRKMIRFLNRVFKDDWAGAATELRNTIWYVSAPAGRRERRIVKEIEEGTIDYPALS